MTTKIRWRRTMMWMSAISVCFALFAHYLKDIMRVDATTANVTCIALSGLVAFCVTYKWIHLTENDSPE